MFYEYGLQDNRGPWRGLPLQKDLSLAFRDAIRNLLQVLDTALQIHGDGLADGKNSEGIKTCADGNRAVGEESD